MTAHASMPRMVSADQMQRLADWSLRKPVIALMGEFSAGKSTLPSLLIGKKIPPTQVVATRMPPVWIRYGDVSAYRVDLAATRHPVDIADRGSIPIHDTRYIRLHCTADVLKQCDLMDTPGIPDPNISQENLVRTTCYASPVMWCTHAGQAWREANAAHGNPCPNGCGRPRSCLSPGKTRSSQRSTGRRSTAVSTVKLRTCSTRMFLSLTDAIRARAEGDTEAPAESGAKQFAEMPEQIIEGVYVHRSFLLSRYAIGRAREEAAPVGSDVGASTERSSAGSILGFVAQDDDGFQPDEHPRRGRTPVVLRSSGSTNGLD